MKMALQPAITAGPGEQAGEELQGPPETADTLAMVTILICTRNRSASLRRTLESVRQLASPAGVEWEVIVVDNNSTDNTRQVVESFRQTSGLDVIYLCEVKRGASCARNAGIRKARGEVIAFTDDDMILDREWLVAITEVCRQGPGGEMYFGQTHTFRPDQARIAIKEGDVEETYSFPCNPGDAGSSNNMIVRRSLLARVGIFDPTLGPGTTIGNSEDTDFTYRVLRSGARIRYCPTIVAYHDHDRLSPQAVQKLFFIYARGKGGFYCKYALRRDWWAIKLCCWEIQSFWKVLWERRTIKPVVRHFIGMFLGFCIRLGIEAKALVYGLPNMKLGSPE
jgi:glycosyltransferase involved in cell wall biosynthesis